jgi:hypothetical protein
LRLVQKRAGNTLEEIGIGKGKGSEQSSDQILTSLVRISESYYFYDSASYLTSMIFGFFVTLATGQGLE